MFQGVTVSGTVSFIATTFGTPTSFIAIEGSGLMTVLAEKFVLFPARLCLILPSLLLILSVIVFKGCPLLCLADGLQDEGLLLGAVTAMGPYGQSPFLS